MQVLWQPSGLDRPLFDELVEVILQVGMIPDLPHNDQDSKGQGTFPKQFDLDVCGHAANGNFSLDRPYLCHNMAWTQRLRRRPHYFPDGIHFKPFVNSMFVEQFLDLLAMYVNSTGANHIRSS